MNTEDLARKMLLSDDTPERLLYEGIVLGENPDELAASVAVVEGDLVVGVVLIGVQVPELSAEGVADVGVQLPREVARDLGRQLLAAADAGKVAGVQA